jgi:signal transduction histidine kinase
VAALGELASGIIHDFRNILQTVISCLDMIESRSDEPAEVRRLAMSALGASERGIGLTKRLLKFSRYEEVDARPDGDGALTIEPRGAIPQPSPHFFTRDFNAVERNAK